MPHRQVVMDKVVEFLSETQTNFMEVCLMEQRKNYNILKNIAYLVCVFFVPIICFILQVDTSGVILGMILANFLMPLASFCYARKFINKDNKIKKWLLSVICPITYLVSYIVTVFLLDLLLSDGTIYAVEAISKYSVLTSFLICELASLVGLIDLKKIMQVTENKKYLAWLWLPIVNSLLLILGFWGYWNTAPDNGGAIYGLILLIVFYVLVAVPTMSIFYCKNIREMGWAKYLCCIYNAVAIGIHKQIYEWDAESLTEIFENSLQLSYVISMFISALICGLITLIDYDVTKRKTEDNSLSQ